MMFLAGAVNGYSMQSLSMGGAVRVSRAAMSKLAAPRMDITVEKSGEFGTTDFTMYFKKVRADLACRAHWPTSRGASHTHTALCWRVQDGNTISPWHEIPLEAGDGMYNFVCEIPKMTLKKMEVRPARPCPQPQAHLDATRACHLLQVATKVEGNPIMQDEKKGKARLYHGPIFWNYGCLPQTWEDPNVKGDADVGGAFGDDDPIDVVEIGAVAQEMGGVVPVKPLGVLSMIDDGEVGTPPHTHLHHLHQCTCTHLHTHTHTHTHTHRRGAQRPRLRGALP
jgi:inorganic pyrophosphatase